MKNTHASPAKPEAQQQTAKDLTIGWIGTGKMGLPMAQNLQKAGFTVVAYDTDRTRLAKSGLDIAESLKELGLIADVLVSMIPNDQALRDIVLGTNNIRQRPGAVFVDLSTVSPNVSAECATALRHAEIDYIRGAVSGSTELAVAARLTVLLSGPEGTIQRCRPLFDTLGSKIFVVGSGEEARYLKLVINTMVAATAAMCAEALVLGQKGGLDWNRMLDVIADSVVASPLISYKLQLLRTRDFSPAFTGEQMLKDLQLAQDASRATGISLPLLSEVTALFEQTVNAGDGPLDFFAALRSTERAAGIDPSR
jgi:3-hydroxyisobutyrate dehydrogenase-like beta-hydroxyacid dehydrogenase